MRRLPAYLAFSLGASLVVSHSAWAQTAAPTADAASCDPYKNYSCLDTYLNKDGDDPFDRMANYYKLEWGQAGPPSDPNAPPGRRDGWPTTPQTSPPMPFTEWPYGGTQNLGVTRPASIDSPFMVGIANTWLGKAMASENIQLYGWIDPGANISTSNQIQGGNAPAAYDYRPNALNFDQAVLYFEKVPDTVQSDHIDWGFRLSGIYGENYRYTTAYGIASEQLLAKNNVNGYDFPMEYLEMFVPQVGQGLLLRLGRYISLPDIEAQLAPNNYMYTHSITYTLDNYTNTGLQSTLALTKQFFLQLGVSVGTEAAPWHLGNTIQNPYQYVPIGPGDTMVLNPLYPDSEIRKDPGSRPAVTGCFRYQSQDGKNNINGCADAINTGVWGYNNLQWYGFTAYHKFDDKWHVSYEFYTEHENGVPNLNNPTVQAINGATYTGNGGYGDPGTPFGGYEGVKFNAPGEAVCSGQHNTNSLGITPVAGSALTCTAISYGTVAYFNYSPNALNNFSIRPELYYDKNGQRTGTPTHYVDFGIGWQHWLSPQIEMRPEVTYYRSLNGPAFNGDSNALANFGVADPPNKSAETVLSGDIIIHF